MSHHHRITLSRGRFASPASRVIEQTRALGPVSRDELARTTGLSLPTVNRSVSALLRAGLLRERPDAAPVGVTDRKSVV